MHAFVDNVAVQHAGLLPIFTVTVLRCSVIVLGLQVLVIDPACMHVN